MQSKAEIYRSNISNIVRKALYKKFPGLKKSQVTELCKTISVNIHSRFGTGQPTDEVNRCGNCGMQQEDLNDGS